MQGFCSAVSRVAPAHRRVPVVIRRGTGEPKRPRPQGRIAGFFQRRSAALGASPSAHLVGSRKGRSSMSDGTRDLACAEYWEESIARSRRRREAAERQLNFGPIDSKRIAVPAALLAGGLAVTEVVTSGGGDGGGGVLPQDATAASATVPADHVTAKPAKTEPVAEKKPAEKKKPAAKRSAARRSAPEGSAAKRSAPKKKKPVVIQTVSQAQA